MKTGLELDNYSSKSEDEQRELLRVAHNHIDNLSFTRAKELYQLLLSQNVSSYHQKDESFKQELNMLYTKLSLYGQVCSATVLYATQEYTTLYQKLQDIVTLYNQLTMQVTRSSKLLTYVHSEYTSHSAFLLNQLGIMPDS